MATTLKSVLERVVGTLEDQGSDTWTLQDLVRYLNDGQRVMHVHRPDLFNVDAEIPLIEGIRQTLPTGGSKLINITHNTVGTFSPVTKVERSLLDAQVRWWRALTPRTEIEHFMYDERQPKVFEVYPPAAVGAKVQVEYASIPADLPEPADGVQLAALAGDINVPDLQSTALQHYIAFRCWAEGSESSHAGMAQAHYAMFANELGIEVQATKAVAPTSPN